MPFSSTARSVAEVPSAGRPAAGTSGRSARTLFCPEAVLFCQQQRLCHGPAGVRQFHYQLRVSRRADQISGGSGARADFLLGIGKSAAYKLF